MSDNYPACAQGNSTDVDGESPESKPNLYKKDLVKHAAAIQTYVTMELTPPGGFGGPCSAVCKKIGDGGWISPAATTWTTGLEALGTSIKTAFTNYKADVDQDVSAEDENVTVPGPESWKAKWVAVAGSSPSGDLAEGWVP